MADVKQKIGQWWLYTVLHTPDVIIESVEFVSILSIQDGFQPGLKCVAIEISGANPLPYIISSNSTAVFLSKSILKSPERYTLVRGSFWSIKLSSEKNKVVSPLGGLYRGGGGVTVRFVLNSKKTKTDKDKTDKNRTKRTKNRTKRTKIGQNGQK